VLVPTFVCHSREKLDSALVNVSVVPDVSDRTTNVMVCCTPANAGFH
jgi:hypothetical protein